MKPRDLIRSCIQSDLPGIEIGPGFNPLAPKRDGYRTTTIDVTNTEALRTAAQRKGIPSERMANLEGVDIVGDACRILELIRASNCPQEYGWIVSSHNFEHLPKPISFFRGCRALLRDDGILGMIIPDKRFCLDRFQPHTTVHGVLRAQTTMEDELEPTWAAFQQRSLSAHMLDATGSRRIAWSDATDSPDAIMAGDCRPAYQALTKSLSSGQPTEFHGHRWRFTPAAFELLILDLRILGIIDLEIDAMGYTFGPEFGVRMKPAKPWQPSPEEVTRLRSELLHRIEDELAEVSGLYRRLQEQL